MSDNPRILVVEDDGDMSFMMKLMLERKGFSVKLALQENEIMRIMRSDSIDLVILDMLLKESTGLEICTGLKKNGHTSHVPIMMMSGHHKARETCIAAGADYFIAKPFEMHDVISHIESLIQADHKI